MKIKFHIVVFSYLEKEKWEKKRNEKQATGLIFVNESTTPLLTTSTQILKILKTCNSSGKFGRKVVNLIVFVRSKMKLVVSHPRSTISKWVESVNWSIKSELECFFPCLKIIFKLLNTQSDQKKKKDTFFTFLYFQVWNYQIILHLKKKKKVKCTLYWDLHSHNPTVMQKWTPSSGLKNTDLLALLSQKIGMIGRLIFF